MAVSSNPETIEELRALLLAGNQSFWPELVRMTAATNAFSEIIFLSSLRKRALKSKSSPGILADSQRLRVALVGGPTLFPLHELIDHMLAVSGIQADWFTGEYNNYRSEIMDESSGLYGFQPNVVIIIPDRQSGKYSGKITDHEELPSAEITRITSEILKLCSIVNERIGAEVILCNFIPSAYMDLGAYRSRSLGSDWSFKKAINLALGQRAPYYVHICDAEFLAYRLGGLLASDENGWFESKLLCSPQLQVLLSKEIAHLIASLKRAPRKVLVLDLDNTLWGGVIGDDGIEGIEIGDTSPRGEAFKAFQAYALSLMDCGILLGVCSKNDYEKALEPFQKHPEMILREHHFVSFKSNWEPKADNLKAMADELGLGLDSFVFVDDNPVEIEIVRQFAPEVTTILLSANPADFVKQLQESRLFEPIAITKEDTQRTEQYRNDIKRKTFVSTSTDMDAYLLSLEMAGSFSQFNSLDLPRIAQLINKSNQFNLTTVRRTEAELVAVMEDPQYIGFSMRLRDRFGDHGLIAVVICHQVEKSTMEIDTWLMSCRILKRQVEDEVMNEIARLAELKKCTRIRGVYLPTAKNSLVRDHYPRFGFELRSGFDDRCEFELALNTMVPFPTKITITSRNYDNPTKSIGSDLAASNNFRQHFSG